MARKRIAFDARYINDRYHGIGRFAFQLLESMASLSTDYDFVVYRGRIQDRRFNWEGITQRQNVTLRFGPGPLYWPHEQLLWPIFIRRDRIDLFHSPYFPIPLLSRSKVIMTVHDMIFERYPQYMPGAWSRPYYKILMKLGLRKSQKIITVSNSTAKDLRNYYKFPLEKLAIIPEGVDNGFSTGETTIPLAEIRERYGLNSQFILSVGARRPHKNFNRLIQAYSRISNEYPHNLILVGSYDTRFPDGIKQELDQNDLNGRVKLLDWVPESDLPGIYQLADFVVLPSLLEGFGLPALESMACGTPVIAADNSSFPEVIGNAGILVDPFQVNQIEDAMRRLLNQKEVRERLTRLGLERAGEFSWDKAAQMTLDTYREVLS
jgi:glycosyltransferase involved in cell wall biosynthesis